MIQFVGHWYEGRKPAFVDDDVVGLLVGPMFVVAEAMFQLGWNKPLQAEIERASARRRCATWRASPERVRPPAGRAARSLRASVGVPSCRRLVAAARLLFEDEAAIVIDVVEIGGNPVGAGKRRLLSVAIAITNGSCGYCAGFRASRQASRRPGGVCLNPSTRTQLHSTRLGDELIDRRLLDDRVLADLGRRRFDAMTTSNAPAWRWRHESLPSWSMSNSWCACLTTETRWPARRRRAMSCSTSVVLPEPEE